VLLSLSLVAASAGCYNGGVVLQASAARRSPPDESLKPSLLVRLIHAPSFVIGTGLDGLGWVFQVLALTQASLTFVQPALGIGVFLLLAFAWFGLAERPRVGDLFGATALAAGIAMVATRAPSPERSIDWARAIVPVILLSAVALAPYVLRLRRSPVALAIATGAAFAVTGLTTAVVAHGVEEKRLDLVVVGLALSIAFGLIGFLAQTSALVTGRVTSVVPIVLLLDTAVPVALAPAVFGERWPAGAAQISMLLGGVVLAILGAMALARSPNVALVRERASGG
jgi:uncharacterized membrane protein